MFIKLSLIPASVLPMNTHVQHAHRHIPARPYDRETLAAYVYDMADVHVKSAEESTPYEKRMTEWMLRQPAWVQVMLVENRVRFEIGARKKTGLPRDTAADAHPDGYHIRRIIRRMEDFEADLSHEVGHIIDAILADHSHLVDGKKRDFYTTANPGYARALNHDRNLPATRRKADLRRTLKTHLAHNIYKPKDYPEESFAHLFELYLMQHHEGKSEAEVNDIMAEYFPKLWPHIRDRIIPAALDIAGELYHSHKEITQSTIRRHTSEILFAMQQAADARHLPHPHDMVSIAGGMARSRRADEWINRFEYLAQPRLPKDPYQRLYGCFGDRFENEAAMRDHFNHHPALKRDARRFALSLDETLAKEGLPGFIKAVHQLELSFAVAQNQQAVSSVVR